MNIGQIVNKVPVQRLGKSSPLLIDSDTLLGVEIECENVQIPIEPTDTRSGYWRVHKDDSLRNHGMEFSFSEPLYGADAVTAIQYLCDHAKKSSYKVSTRTGLHVHVDMRNVEVEKFRNFCTLYALMEPLVYNFIGDKRSGNMFCLPWWAADTDVEKFSRLIPKAEEAPAFVRDQLQNFHKYSGLNLQALVNFGTAEFRQMRTTFNTSRIIDWINIILSIRKFAVGFNGGPTELCRQLEIYGPYGFVQRVFGSLVDKLWYPEFIQDAIGKGLATAEWFLESKLELWLRSNRGKSVFDYILNKASKEAEDAKGDHPGLVAFKKNNMPDSRVSQRPTRRTKVSVQNSQLGTYSNNLSNLIAQQQQTQFLSSGSDWAFGPPPPAAINVGSDTPQVDFDNEDNQGQI